MVNNVADKKQNRYGSRSHHEKLVLRDPFPADHPETDQ
jgi:hypothetical protein